jgi:intein/homing endonuclease
MTETDIAYAAGFFDGEGCIMIAKNGAVDVRITNTSKQVLLKLQAVFGGKIGDRSQKINKAQYSYCFYGENAIEFIKTIKPYLVEKLPQAETVLEYYELRNNIKRVTIPGEKGQFSNPDRQVLVEVFRDILSEQKLEEN